MPKFLVFHGLDGVKHCPKKFPEMPAKWNSFTYLINRAGNILSVDCDLKHRMGLGITFAHPACREESSLQVLQQWKD